MEQWSEGIYLLGRYGDLLTGCWLLVNGRSAAIVELPPHTSDQWSPAVAAKLAARQLSVNVEYLLCTHAHDDHLSMATLQEFHRAFPNAVLHVHDRFEPHVAGLGMTRYFQNIVKLGIDGEPLFLVYAPKHSWTDTFIVFRGVAFSGDWEFNTIRSVNDGDEKQSVPLERKLQSLDLLRRFPDDQSYVVHQTFSAHANERRNNVDFAALMEDTKQDRQFW